MGPKSATRVGPRILLARSCKRCHVFQDVSEFGVLEDGYRDTVCKGCWRRWSAIRFPKRVFESRQCVICTTTFTPSRGNHVTCSAWCSRTMDRAGYKRTALHWRTLYAEDGPACYLCDQDIDPTDFEMVTGRNGITAFRIGAKYPTVDHVIARANGGPDTRENARLAHFDCNSRKSDATLDLAQAI